MFEINIISTLLIVIAWCVIIFLMQRKRKVSNAVVPLWKALLVVIVSIFAFHINIPLFNVKLGFAVLPLGVWFIKIALRNKKGAYTTYKPFAWLGFWSNYIFLVVTLLAIPLKAFIFPENQITTHIATVDEAVVITTNASQTEPIQLTKNALQIIETAHSENIYAEVWYYDTFVERKEDERFPYYLYDAKVKWGSAVKHTIYIEKDGQGLLISTPQKQYYFRTETSFIERGEGG